MSIQLSPRAAQLADEALRKSRECSSEVRDEVVKRLLHAMLDDSELETLARIQARCIRRPESSANKTRGLDMPWQHGGASLI